MRELTYFVAVSLDGRIASPSHTFEAFPVEGDHIDMVVRDWTDTLPAVGLAQLGLVADRSRFDTVLMGWNTFAAGFPFGVHDPYPHLRELVFTHDPQRDVPGDTGAVELTDADPVEVVRALRSEDGSGIWLCGGGKLAAALVDEIDRLVLKVNPVVLGDGIPVLATAGYTARAFALERSTPYRSGVVVNEYARH